MTRGTNQTRRSPIRTVLLAACVWLPALDASGQDFNGDGAKDIVVGVPYEGYYDTGDGRRGLLEAGAVDVIYGASPSHPEGRTQHWTLASAGVPAYPQAGDHFGYAVAWGHFNADAHPDLAIGIPGRDVDGIEDAGAVVILHGAPGGLVASGPFMVAAPRFLRQGTEDVPGVPKHGDNFGFSLTAGYSDNGPLDYVAAGAPGYAAGSAGDQGRGEVVVIYPPGQGPNQLWEQVVGTPEPGDWFGFSLAAGNFGRNSPGYAGLAIGVPGEDVDGGTDAGSVEVLYMSNTFGNLLHLHSAGAQLLRQSTFASTTQSHSWFGFALAATDLTDNYDDFSPQDELVIGEPFRTVGFYRGGAIHVVHGSDTGLDTATAETAAPGRWMLGGRLIGAPEDGDLFGFSLTRLHRAVAVGAPGANGVKGTVHVIHGVPGGLTAVGAQVLCGSTVGDLFGWSVQWGHDHTLLVGVPGRLDGGGSVSQYQLDATGTFVPKATWTQDKIFSNGERTEPGDGFGASVGAGGLPRMTFTW
jgi:hypothetical protein